MHANKYINTHSKIACVIFPHLTINIPTYSYTFYLFSSWNFTHFPQDMNMENANIGTT